MPIELLGDGLPTKPVIGEARLGLDGARLGQTTRLWFLCHRCGFYAAPEYEAGTDAPVKVKASVRVMGGASGDADKSVPWIDITDATVQLADDERIHGGVNGGLYTTRITLALDAATRARLVALPAYNRIQFRFNGTDGESNGFRVLDLQLQDDGGANLTRNTIQRVDPKIEQDAGRTKTPDVDAGEKLWYERGSLLKSSIVRRPIQAACSSCHAANGRDLQYFNYSNNAIIQRSRFHGLTDAQGAQIAAYLRHSLRDTPHAAKARPWNPPYQPGPGLDCPEATCSTAPWAAGAGLEAVLRTPSEALNVLFGKPSAGPVAVSQTDVDAVMDANATMNVRQMPVPMQFPDWNAWLPSHHPRDVWPTSAGGSFEAGETFNGQKKDPNGKYNAVIAWLTKNKNPNGKAGDWSHLTADQRVQIMAMFTDAGWEMYNFLGGGRGNHIPGGGQGGAQVGAATLMARSSASRTAVGPATAFGVNSFIERAVASMLHWNAVKQWEIAQDYALEGNQAWFIGEKDSTGQWKGRGEAHGWPFNAPSVFYLAPHMVYQQDVDGGGKVTRDNITGWETNNVVASYYRSNQWYQLQMTVNAGGRSGWSNYPMDWPYLTAFDELVAQKVGSATPAAKAAQQTHLVRLLQGRIKAAQYLNNGLALYDPAQPNLVANSGNYGRGKGVKHLVTANFLDNATSGGVAKSPFAFLDEITAGLYVKMINGSIHQFDTLYGATNAAAWRRCDPQNTQLGEPEPIAGFRFCLDRARQPLGKAADGSFFMNLTNSVATTEQKEQYGLWKATQLGAEPTRLATWSAWIERMWPR